jgi:hypothetical protein
MKLFDQLQFVAVLFFMVGFSSFLFGETKTDSRPNILFIFSDDHASHAIGAYGSNRNKTPNMDRLTQEGMRFKNCCVTNSICGPSRTVLQTGKYSHVNGYDYSEILIGLAERMQKIVKQREQILKPKHKHDQ